MQYFCEHSKFGEDYWREHFRILRITKRVKQAFSWMKKNYGWTEKKPSDRPATKQKKTCRWENKPAVWQLQCLEEARYSRNPYNTSWRFCLSLLSQKSVPPSNCLKIPTQISHISNVPSPLLTHIHTLHQTAPPHFWSLMSSCTLNHIFHIRWRLGWPSCPYHHYKHSAISTRSPERINDQIQQIRKTHSTTWRGRARLAPLKPLDSLCTRFTTISETQTSLYQISRIKIK